MKHDTNINAHMDSINAMLMIAKPIPVEKHAAAAPTPLRRQTTINTGK